jgi:hypothetical protein
VKNTKHGEIMTEQTVKRVTKHGIQHGIHAKILIKYLIGKQMTAPLSHERPNGS